MKHKRNQKKKQNNNNVIQAQSTRIRKFLNPQRFVSTLLAEAFPLCFSALYCHSLRGFGWSRFVLVVSVPRKRPLQTAVWDSR